MRSVAPMKTAKIGYIVISILLCALGIFLIAVPDFSISAVGTICGAILIVFGIVRLVGYFSKDLYRLAFQYDLAFGIMMIALGMIMLLHPNSLMNFICITLGLSFFADGLFKIQISIDSKRFGIREWWLILALAIITVIFGILLIAHPSESSRILTVLIGISMLCEGVLNISTVITAVKIIKHQRPDVIEIDYYEERED
ncbi:MAG: hypothetical protein HFE78_00195 [Clostridiales bacterium]|nr:hypothetical protein [Clostridiales bacterium]